MWDDCAASVEAVCGNSDATSTRTLKQPSAVMSADDAVQATDVAMEVVVDVSAPTPAPRQTETIVFTGHTEPDEGAAGHGEAASFMPFHALVSEDTVADMMVELRRAMLAERQRGVTSAPVREVAVRMPEVVLGDSSDDDGDSSEHDGVRSGAVASRGVLSELQHVLASKTFR